MVHTTITTVANLATLSSPRTLSRVTPKKAVSANEVDPGATETSFRADDGDPVASLNAERKRASRNEGHRTPRPPHGCAVALRGCCGSLTKNARCRFRAAPISDDQLVSLKINCVRVEHEVLHCVSSTGTVRLGEFVVAASAPTAGTNF